MNKSSTILNLEQAAALTREYLSAASSAPTGEALRGRCSRGLGPPVHAAEGKAQNAPTLFLQADVLAWCMEQLPERIRRVLLALERLEDREGPTKGSSDD